MHTPMLALLQLDSASLPLLEEMTQLGRLPTIAALRREGRWSTLGASTRLFEAALFPSLYSGSDVGDHGLYSAFPWSASEQRARFMHDFPQPRAAWERLARAGRRSLVVDPYQAWAPEDAVGAFIAGWQFENRMVLPRWSAPRGTLRELARRFGAPSPGELVFGRSSASDLLRVRHAILAAPRRLAEAVTHLLREEAFDLLWVGFSFLHLAGHYFWDLTSVVDRQQLGAETRRQLDATLTDVYEAADAALERIMHALPPGTDVIVFSPDGMGPDTSRSDMLPDMLGSILDGRAAGRSAPRGPRSALWRLRAAVPTRGRAAVARLLGDTAARNLAARLYLGGLDWRRTRAFAVPGDFCGFVRLNLRGRERFGIVDPADAEALMDEVAAGLATFCDPDGAPSVAGVERVPESIRRGACGEHLPDLVVRWSERPSARLHSLHSPRFGTVVRRGGGTGLTGNHADGAWALVLPGRSRRREPSRPPEILDLAVTACKVLGADATDLVGESLLELA